MTSGEIIVLDEKNLTIRAESVKHELAKYWDKDYINQRIDLVKNHNHKMFLIFSWMSGLRVSEVVGLRKKDLDFQNYVMAVRWLKSRKYKTRIVPIHPALRDLMQLYTASMNLDDRIFPFTRINAYQVCMKTLGGSPHRLRHSFAVNWLRCGGDIVVLHRIMGHSKIQTTMEYLKIVPVDQGKELIKIQFR
jgi:integrase/recombinase XerD